MTPLRAEFKKLSRLSAPVALTQLGMMMTGVVDTLMLSRVGVNELAASAVGSSWQWTWMALGLGVVMGIDPLISQAHGQGDERGMGVALQRGLVVAVLVSVPLCVMMALTEEWMLLLGQEPETARLAGVYCIYRIPMLPCFLAYSALRQWLQGRTLMAPATWVMWIGNLLNVVLNWALIFGHFGSPPLGIVGASVASSITTLFVLCLLTFWIRVFELHRGGWQSWTREALALSGLLRVVRLGLPVGMQLCLEACAFAVAALMAGWLSTVALGSHQLVLTLAALSYMVPLGIAQGSATRVGNLIGRGDEASMRRASWAAVSLGAGVMVVSALLFSVFRWELPRFFTDETELIAMSAAIFPIAAAFQLWDGTQVVAAGVLRGMGRTDAPLLVNLVGYYVLGLPLAYALGFVLQFGLVGIWVGLAVGLTAVALSLVLWVQRTLRRPFSDLRVSAE